MYQTPFADRIRNEAGIATIAVGAITEADHVNSIIAAGRADLCASRGRTWRPDWTLRAAAELGYDGVVADQYLAGGEQLRRLARRARARWPVRGLMAPRSTGSTRSSPAAAAASARAIAGALAAEGASLTLSAATRPARRARSGAAAAARARPSAT